MRPAHRGQIPRGPEDCPRLTPQSAMNQLTLFLPCAAGVEEYLAPEILQITGLPPGCMTKQRGGVAVRTSFAHAMLLNLYSRLAQRVLVLVSYTEYRSEQDIYRAGLAGAVGAVVHAQGEHQGRGDGAAQPADLAELCGAEGQRRGVRPLP